MAKYRIGILGCLNIFIACNPLFSSEKQSVSRKEIPELSATQIDDSFEKAYLGKNIEYFLDSGHTMKFSNIQNDNLQWRKNATDFMALSIEPATLWIRYKIKNLSQKQLQWVLQFDFPTTDYITWYFPETAREKESSFLHQETEIPGYRAYATGQRLPFSTHIDNNRSFIFPGKSEAGAEQIFYLKIDTEDTMYVPLILFEKRAFQLFYNAETSFNGLYYGLAIIMVLYNLFVFFSVKKTSYLYYVFYIILTLLVVLEFTGDGKKYLWPSAPRFSHNVLPTIIGILAATLMRFLMILFETKARHKLINLMFQILVLIPFVAGISTILIQQYRFSFVLNTSLVLLGALAYVFLTYVAVSERNRTAVYLLLGFSAYALGAFGFQLESLGVPLDFIYSRYLFQIGTGVEIILFSLALADRINILQSELLILNKNLETKVVERTSELRLSLTEVQQLKELQDKDYYLTSLLLNPLQTQRGLDEPVQAKVFIEHKKKVEIKQKTIDIGGDFICIEEIQILGRNYLFMVNADAMGKSIQGAGGAIVFGASLKSFILRTQFNRTLLTFPELWLRDLFFDMQDLFTSFDGSMLISGILGLLDLQNNTLYFINCEHPYPVLYRNQKASFLSSHSMLKIGCPMFNTQIKVEAIPLEPDDLLILGSDGRDDLILSETLKQEIQRSHAAENIFDDTIEGKMNHNEIIFLRIVELAKGDIQKITELIKGGSTLTDDISILTIRIKKGDGNKARKLNVDKLKEAERLLLHQHPEETLSLLRREYEKTPFEICDIKLMRLLMKTYKALKFDEERKILEYLVYSLAPQNMEAIVRHVERNMANKRLDIAADYAEILRLREPDKPENILLSAKVFYEMGMLEKARDLAAFAKTKTVNEDMLNEIEGFLKSMTVISNENREIEKHKQNFAFRLFAEK